MEPDSDDFRESPAIGVARWVCGVAGAVAALSAFQPWVRAHLADRGADLLVVTRSGWDLGFTGWAVVGVGVAVVAVCLATAWWLRLRPLVFGLPLFGIALAVLPLTRLDAGEPVAYKLSTLRIGTFQTDAPVTSSAVGIGLWLCVAAGVVVVVAGLYWAVRSRRSGAPAPDRSSVS